jgi:Carboxypeptidase regulatory-like domain/TonB-dependent Receptor Plug Domain/TonB dependent receptor
VFSGRSIGLAAATLFLGILSSIPADAQVAGATLSGTITDSSGGVVPGARVIIKNVATGVTTEVTTNSDGFYNAANLLPGEYSVTVSSKGYTIEERTGISLTVGAQQVFDLTLRVGSTKEVLVVTAEAPSIQLNSSDISAVVNETTVRELPLNGRSWTDLAELQPGVNAIHTQPDFSAGTDRGNRGFGQQLTISGARPQQNNYRLDGVSLNDYANGAPGSVLGGNLGVDAIQEFSVLTSNYSAEYGKTSGGVVNAITRSGTNQIHGSVYEFLRNNKLDARNYFDDPTKGTPPFKRNQFGGAIGGPILKDHTFFFADYEGIRQSKGISTLTTVPSQATRNGQMCSLDPTCVHSITVDPNAAKYLTFYHLPDPGTIFGNGDLGTYTFVGQQIVNENFFTGRVDHKISNGDSLFGTYMYDKTPYSSPDGLNNVEFDTLTSRQFLSVEETHLFNSRFANSIRVGGNHEAVANNESLKAINPAAADASLGVGGSAFAGRDAAQVLMGGGVTDFTGGVGGSPTYFYHWNSAQVYDDAFLTRGTHSLRFGVAIEREMLNLLADTDPNGIWNFDNLEGFLTNQPTRFQGGIASTLSPRNLRQTVFGVYLQDDWRAKPNLTLNLGLRYEMSTVISETAGKLANLRNISDATAHLGNPFFSNPTLKDFEPRFGFAWDPLRNGKTAVRGGIGMFDVQPLPYQFPLLVSQAVPFFSYTVVKDPTAVCSTACPNPFPNFGGQNISFPVNRLRSTYLEPNPKRNYVMQWNLNIQQQLAPSLTGMIAYVGSRGVHQPFRVDDANMAIPTLTSAGYLWLPNAPIINPNFGSIKGMFYRGHSQYDAMEAQLMKRMSHGFQVQGTFTWSKSIDSSSASVAGDSFGNSISSLDWFDLRLTRGPSDFNVGRTVVINGVWDVPTPKSFAAPAQAVLGGWELGLIFTASDGVPFTATWGTGSDPALTQSGDDWAFPNRLGGSGCSKLTRPGDPNHYIKTECFAIPTKPSLSAFWQANCVNGAADPTTSPQCFNLRGNAGRNILTGPGVTELDFSLFKNNYIPRISERFNVQFRAELFNILNHANFAPTSTPTNTDIFDGTGAPNSVAGQLTRTTTTAREIQLAVKVIF